MCMSGPWTQLRCEFWSQRFNVGRVVLTDMMHDREMDESIDVLKIPVIRVSVS